MSKILMVIAPEQFRDEELFVTKTELEKAKHTITIVSTKIGECKGTLGGKTIAEKTINQVWASDYNAIVFVGGQGSEIYINNQTAVKLVKTMLAENKIIAAICLAPVIFAKAGLLKGKRATVTISEVTTIKAQGALYVGPGVIIDGNIITADGPKASQMFGQKINQALDK